MGDSKQYALNETLRFAQLIANGRETDPLYKTGLDVTLWGSILMLAYKNTPVYKKKKGSEPGDREISDMWMSMMNNLSYRNAKRDRCDDTLHKTEYECLEVCQNAVVGVSIITLKHTLTYDTIDNINKIMALYNCVRQDKKVSRLEYGKKGGKKTKCLNAVVHTNQMCARIFGVDYSGLASDARTPVADYKDLPSFSPAAAFSDKMTEFSSLGYAELDNKYKLSESLDNIGKSTQLNNQMQELIRNNVLDMDKRYWSSFKAKLNKMIDATPGFGKNSLKRDYGWDPESPASMFINILVDNYILGIYYLCVERGIRCVCKDSDGVKVYSEIMLPATFMVCE